jgi:hypothetical protein
MSRSFQVLREGLILGLIGYASVALLYTIFDFLAVRGFLFTVDLLGKAMFRGLKDPSVLVLPIQIDITVIFWYNMFHLIISLIIGLIITGLIYLFEKNPGAKYYILYILTFGLVFTIFAVSFLTTTIRGLLPLWSIILANIFAVILAGSYLIKKHPGLWYRLNPFGSN